VKGTRKPATAGPDGSYHATVGDRLEGIQRPGTLPVREAQGVHSLTDVPVFAKGPCQELFGGVYNNIDIFFKMAECLGLSEK
jgi:alkaline phosphatase